MAIAEAKKASGAEFSVSRSALLKELELAVGVVEKKTTIPILGNLLIEATKDRLKISATDLELAIRAGCEAKVARLGSGTIPAKRLLDIIRSLPEAEITFKIGAAGECRITCQRASFKLNGMATDNFPAIPDTPKDSVSIPSGTLLKLIERTSFAISREESRYTLNGALLLFTPTSTCMVATDGHRLALAEFAGAVPTGATVTLKHLIPKNAIVALRGLLKDEAPVEFSKDEIHLFFTVGGRTLISRLLTGQFPNYEAVLPKGNNRTLEIDAAALAAAVKRVALLADTRANSIRLAVEPGKLTISTGGSEFGEASETLDSTHAGEPLQIGFNYQYLLDFLGVLDGGAVRLELKDDQSAGQFRPVGDDGYRYVVMPMRI